MAQENREHIEEGGLQNRRINPMYEGNENGISTCLEGLGLASLQAVWYFVMFGSSSSGRSSGRSGSGKRMLLIGTTLS